MPRDLGEANQSHPTNQENTKPQSSVANTFRSSTGQKEDEDFVDIDHEDAGIDMHEAGHGAEKQAAEDLELQRFGNNLKDAGDEEDDSDDEHDHMANHPLLNMLTGRLNQRRRGSTHKWDRLHPVTQVLSVANVNDCTELEEEAFPEHERCSRDKFEYRLSRCPELSLGLFSRPTQAEADGMEAPPKRRLIAHIIATRSPAPSVTDASMTLPPDWKTVKSASPTPGKEEPLGHQELGGTICVHSLAVAKEHQGIGLGSILMKAYIQRMKDSKCAERIALLAHEHLVGFYTGLGYENMGASTATFGGGGWNNLVLEFGASEDDD